MKLVCISDTHNQHKHLTSKARFPNALPDGDVLLHAGDFSGVGQKGEVMDFFEWCIKQAPRFTYGVVFIAGNHDKSFDPKFFRTYEDSDLWDDTSHSKKPTWLRNTLSDFELSDYGVSYLENSSIEIGDGSNTVKIWGSPYTPWFHGDRWAFNAHRGPDIAKIWEEIPRDTDIIITHGPVAYKLDYIPSTQEYVGCEDLRKKVEGISPLLHLSGHIHEGHGWDENVFTTFINASICNHAYNPVNKPWEVEIRADRTLDIY